MGRTRDPTYSRWSITLGSVQRPRVTSGALIVNWCMAGRLSVSDAGSTCPRQGLRASVLYGFRLCGHLGIERVVRRRDDQIHRRDEFDDMIGL
jgi:hypothetical protein